MQKQKTDIQKKFLIKKLKIYMQNRYESILNYLLYAKDENAVKNVETLIKYEPNFFNAIKAIQANKSYHNLQINFFNKVNMQNLDAEIYLKETKEKIILVNEQLNNIKNSNAISARSVKRKNTMILQLEKRLDELLYTETELTKILDKIQEEQKRPRGRPKKDEMNERLNELDEEYEDEEN